MRIGQFIKHMMLCGLLFMGCGYPSFALNDTNPDSIERLLEQGERAFEREEYAASLKYFLTARQKVNVKRFPKLAFYASQGLGSCYFRIDDNEKAFDYYCEALRFCDTYKLGRKNRSASLSGIAGIYFRKGDHENAERITYESYQEALAHGDSLLVATHAQHLALLANQKKDFEKMKQYCAIAEKYGTGMATDIKVLETDMYFQQKAYEKVIKLANEIIGDPHIIAWNRTMALVYLGHIYQGKKEYGKALHYALQAAAIAPFGWKKEVYELVSSLYMETHRSDLALAYKDSVILYTDSVNRMDNKRQVENLRIKLEMLNIQKEMDRKSARLTNLRIYSVFISVICLLVIAATWYVIRSWRQKSRQSKRLMELEVEKEHKQKELIRQQMKETELLSKMKEERFRHSIELKNRELSTASMFISSRNDLLRELLAMLQSVKDTPQIPALKELTLRLKQLLKEGDNQDAFLIDFEKANPSFMAALRSKHPELLPSDIRFLSYIRMNLTSQEIASLLNIANDSCKRRKIRISKKLGLESSSLLYGYISSI